MSYLKQKSKKLIGTIIIPIWLMVFLVSVSILGEILLPSFNKFETFLFYLLWRTFVGNPNVTAHKLDAKRKELIKPTISYFIKKKYGCYKN